MKILAGVFIGLIIFGCFATISYIGKDRKPLTPGVASTTVALNLIIAWLLFAGYFND